jgi:hypothetical protein
LDAGECDECERVALRRGRVRHLSLGLAAGRRRSRGCVCGRCRVRLEPGARLEPGRRQTLVSINLVWSLPERSLKRCERAQQRNPPCSPAAAALPSATMPQTLS